jgi:hypothetical protein
MFLQEHRLTETLPSHWLKLLPFQQRLLPPLDILLKQDLKLLLFRGRLCRNINHWDVDYNFELPAFTTERATSKSNKIIGSARN